MLTMILCECSLDWLFVQDLYGFNLAGLQFIQRELESRGTHLFTDVSQQLKEIKKKRKLTLQKT